MKKIINLPNRVKYYNFLLFKKLGFRIRDEPQGIVDFLESFS